MKKIITKDNFILNLLILLVFLVSIDLQAFNYNINYNQAIQYSNNEMYDESDIILKKIINEAINEQKYNWLIDSYVSLGYNQYLQNNFVKSIEYYVKGIKYKEKYKIENHKQLDFLYKQYAYVNSILGNQIVAIEYYQKAQMVAYKQKNYTTYLNFKIDEITSLMYLGYNSSALKLLYQLENEVVKYNNKETILVLYLNIIDCNIKLNKPYKAQFYLEKTHQLIKKIDDKDYNYNYNLLNAQTLLAMKDTSNYISKLIQMQNNDWGLTNNNSLKLEIFKFFQKTDIKRINKFELLDLELYYKSIDDKEALIEIYKILSLLENNSKYMNKYISETNNYITKTKIYLNEALLLNEKLNKDLIKITENNLKLAYYNKIYLIIAIAITILFVLSMIICLMHFAKKKLLLKHVDLIDNNFMLKSNLATLILNLQTHIFSNEVLSKDFMINSINQLINYQRSIKE